MSSIKQTCYTCEHRKSFQYRANHRYVVGTRCDVNNEKFSVEGEGCTQWIKWDHTKQEKKKVKIKIIKKEDDQVCYRIHV